MPRMNTSLTRENMGRGRWVWVRIVALLILLASARTSLASGGYVSRLQDASPAERDVMTARAAVVQADANLRLVQNKLINQVHSSPEWTDATNQLLFNARKIDALRMPILISVRRQPEYQANLIALEKLQEQLEGLDAEAPDADRFRLAGQLLKLRMEMSKQEQAALLAPGPELQNAVDALHDAYHARYIIWYQDERNLKHLPEWQQARNALAAAEDRLYNAKLAMEREKRPGSEQGQSRMMVRVGF